MIEIIMSTWFDTLVKEKEKYMTEVSYRLYGCDRSLVSSFSRKYVNQTCVYMFETTTGKTLSKILTSSTFIYKVNTDQRQDDDCCYSQSD